MSFIPFQEASTGVVTIDDNINPGTVQVVLDYIYTGGKSPILLIYSVCQSSEIYKRLHAAQIPVKMPSHSRVW